ncbi:MAG: hypothetical protein ACI8UD_000201 [Planctomycetota bacterium]|jgi:hypothetical protein
MHLKPVYLLAPKPEPPTVPSRRAFMIAGGTFLAGAALGGACGYAAGSSAVVEAHDDPKPLQPSGNAELDELRRLALAAPIDELVKHWPYFADTFATSYRKDEHLPNGIERLIHYVKNNENIDRRRVFARVLAQTIELGEPSLQKKLGHYLPALARIR